MSPANTPLDPPLDPRTHPYRDDIAADFLEGKVESKSFVPGRQCRLGTAQSAVMTKPVTANSIEGVMQASELLFGEAFTIYDESNGWAWGQCGHDGYVATHGLTHARTLELTHDGRALAGEDLRRLGQQDQREREPRQGGQDARHAPPERPQPSGTT